MQEKIGIITDSTCDIPADFIKKLGIEVLPLRILYKDKEFRDGVDITAEEVYAQLEDEIPTTSLPGPDEVEALFLKMKSQGFTHIIVIHISSGLSGTGQMIQTVAQQIEGLVIKVIDSKSISMGLGFIVIEAARAIQRRMNFEAICHYIKSVQERLSVFFVLGTLEYLKKGGRIGRVSGTIGQLLSIKPIITVDEDGVYSTYSKVRGRKQSIDRLFVTAKERLSQAANQIAVCYGGAQEEAANLIKRLEELPNIKELIVSTVSPVIGVHTGPGTLGFAVLQPE